MKDYKLTIELLPKGAWGNDFSRTLSKKDWDILRQKCYEKANHKCAICGYNTDELDAHEVWDFNMENKTQTLVDILALCSRCHGVKHYRNSQRLGYGENVKRHFMDVNNCNEIEFAMHLTKAQMDFEDRNKIFRWKIVADLNKFGGNDIGRKESFIPIIDNPYTQEKIKYLKNQTDLGPRILDIVVDNYKGTIKVVCDRTNKIEWYDDKNNRIQTKYNFAEKLNNVFSVKSLYYPFIMFKLIGPLGKMNSKKFKLEEYKK